jgi:hypothetical protein
VQVWSPAILACTRPDQSKRPECVAAFQAELEFTCPFARKLRWASISSIHLIHLIHLIHPFISSIHPSINLIHLIHLIHPSISSIYPSHPSHPSISSISSIDLSHPSHRSIARFGNHDRLAHPEDCGKFYVCFPNGNFNAAACDKVTP